MSTSIAALPAYKSSKTTRTKARSDRTIFGTTLDNSSKARRVFQDETANSSAQSLFEVRHKKWRTPTPSKQNLLDAAWGIKDYSQAEIGEQHVRGYSSLSIRSNAETVEKERSAPTIKEEASNEQIDKVSKPETPLVAYKDQFGVYNVYKENLGHKIRKKRHCSYKLKAANASPRPLGKPRSTDRRRRRPSMSDQTPMPGVPKQFRSSYSRALQVPKFPLPPGGRNHMRTASLKITETGAKDLINAGPINKVGLGSSLQYNHESFKKRETPNQYMDHGNVFSLGQKGHSTTTNCEVSGPGGFYKISTPERSFNERHSHKSDGESVYSLPYEPSVSSRRTYEAAARINKAAAASQKSTEQYPVSTPTNLQDIIPLNILHKFGSEEVQSLLQGREREIKQALEEANDSYLSHSGVVPPRTDVPELNHPINPPATYYSNFGQSLKYDKFDGHYCHPATSTYRSKMKSYSSGLSRIISHRLKQYYADVDKR